MLDISEGLNALGVRLVWSGILKWINMTNCYFKN